MLIERTDNEIIIRLPLSADTEDLQEILNYARYKELTSKVDINQVAVDKLSSQINSKWWSKNKSTLLK